QVSGWCERRFAFQIQRKEHRIVGAMRASQAERIVSDTVPCPDYHIVANTVCQAYPRGEKRFTQLDSAVTRDAANSTDPHQVVFEVVDLHAAVRPGRHGEVFPASPDRKSQVWCYLPAVTNIHAEQLGASRIFLVDLKNAPQSPGFTEQECSHAVVVVE